MSPLRSIFGIGVNGEASEHEVMAVENARQELSPFDQELCLYTTTTLFCDLLFSKSTLFSQLSALLGNLLFSKSSLFGKLFFTKPELSLKRPDVLFSI